MSSYLTYCRPWVLRGSFHLNSLCTLTDRNLGFVPRVSCLQRHCKDYESYMKLCKDMQPALEDNEKGSYASPLQDPRSSPLMWCGVVFQISDSDSKVIKVTTAMATWTGIPWGILTAPAYRWYKQLCTDYDSSMRPRTSFEPCHMLTHSTIKLPTEKLSSFTSGYFVS